MQLLSKSSPTHNIERMRDIERAKFKTRITFHKKAADNETDYVSSQFLSYSFVFERDSGKGIASGYFQSHSNHYLQVSVLRSVFVQDAAACSRECVRQPNCFSVNVAVNLDEHKKLRLCKLLATTSYYAQENLRPHPFFHHYSTIRASEVV